MSSEADKIWTEKTTRRFIKAWTPSASGEFPDENHNKDYQNRNSDGQNRDEKIEDETLNRHEVQWFDWSFNKSWQA